MLFDRPVRILQINNSSATLRESRKETRVVEKKRKEKRHSLLCSIENGGNRVWKDLLRAYVRPICPIEKRQHSNAPTRKVLGPSTDIDSITFG